MLSLYPLIVDPFLSVCPPDQGSIIMAKTMKKARFSTGSGLLRNPGGQRPRGKAARKYYDAAMKAWRNSAAGKRELKRQERADAKALADAESVVSDVEFAPPTPVTVRCDVMDDFDQVGCRITLDLISQLHSQQFVIEPKQPVYYVVPLLAAYFFYYQYPPILPLALATPSVHYEYDGDAGFKLLFCPRGIDANTSRDLIIDPPFADGKDFQSNAHTFSPTDLLMTSIP